MTEVHAGGKFDDNVYKVSGGLHGVGVKCVNALSEWTEVEVVKNGKVYLITFARGEIVKPLAHRHRADADAAAQREERHADLASCPTRRSSPTPSSATRRCSTACASWRTSTRA